LDDLALGGMSAWGDLAPQLNAKNEIINKIMFEIVIDIIRLLYYDCVRRAVHLASLALNPAEGQN